MTKIPTSNHFLTGFVGAGFGAAMKGFAVAISDPRTCLMPVVLSTPFTKFDVVFFGVAI
jgi:hypothetical protein